MNHLGTLLLNHYQVIYADPPWPFKPWSERGGGRSANAHYDYMSLEQIMALPVRAHAAKHCTLFLWGVDWMTPKEIGSVIESWGFEYKTKAFVWIKTNKHSRFDSDDTPLVPLPISERDFKIGCGHHTRKNPEDVLLATVGHPQRFRKDIRQLVFAPIREHSRKPDEVRERIEQLYAGPYLELFARESAPGWDCWGNEVGLFDNGSVRTRRRPSKNKTNDDEGEGPISRTYPRQNPIDDSHPVRHRRSLHH